MTEAEKIRWAEEIVQKIVKKMDWVREKSKNKLPYRTDENGEHDSWEGYHPELPDQGICWWTNGFWPGLLWLLYQVTGEIEYAKTARNAQKKLREAFDVYYGLHHDVGFMYLLGEVADYRLTGNESGKKYGLLAAQLLAGRFNPVGNFLRAWNDIPEEDTRGWTIIDSMMNIQLLFWAYEVTKDPRFSHIATLHADTVRKYAIREDGSAKHIVEFHPETGEYLRSHGGQGYERGSSWSRGQAWALYGFSLAYRHCGKAEYLNTARKVAEYVLGQLGCDGKVPVDFKQPELPDWEDGCGACVLASGLLELAELLPVENRQRYVDGAVKILSYIDRNHCWYGEENDSFVQNCSASYHTNEHHITMVYADYFYLEAMLKLSGRKPEMW